MTVFSRSVTTSAAHIAALGLAFALAACGSGGKDGAGTAAVETAAAPSPVAVTAPADVLLDDLVKPQRPGRYAPRDDCGETPGARDFRHKLADAVVTGDADAIAALASPDIKLGFGGDDGRERFLANLKKPGGELIAELKRVLALGCAAGADGLLTAPWHFAQDMGDIDGYSATIVTDDDVPLLAAADAKSAVKQRISWDVVELNDGLYPERAFQLVTAVGEKGYVATDKLRSLLDYRLLVNRENGEWKITAFLAGD